MLEDKTFSGRPDVKFGALDSVPKRLVLALVEAALKGGNCTVSLLEGSGDELLREMFAHQIDLMVCNYSPTASEMGKVYSRSVAKVAVGVFGAPRFAPLKRGFPKSLEGQSFVLPTSHSKLRHDLEHYFSVNKLRIVPVVETQDTSVQKLLGIEGYGLIPLPEFTTKDLVREKKLVRIGMLPEVKEEFWLVSAQRKIENPIAAKVMKSFELSIA
jgi:LysR family transcriptional activator of nhaA